MEKRKRKEEKEKKKIAGKNEDIDSIIQLNELGVNPNKIFTKESIKKDNKKIKLSEEIEIINNKYFEISKQQIDNICKIEKDHLHQQIFYLKLMGREISKTIILNLKNEYFLYTGNIRGESYIYSPKDNYCQLLNLNENLLYKLNDHSRITSCCFYENEKGKILIYNGSEKGSILVYEKLNLNQNKFQFVKIIHPHTKQINYMNVNQNLNMLIDCSNDGFINIYSLPNLKIIRVIYQSNVIIKKVFLSSSPLPSFITYSSENKLTSYSINGTKLSCVNVENNFYEPLIITSDNFMDYLIYRYNRSYDSIIVKKLPYLGTIEN